MQAGAPERFGYSRGAQSIRGTAGFFRAAAGLAAAGLALQAAYFALSLFFQPTQPSGTPRDALIVYGGGPGRLEAGMAWLKRGDAPVLVYSNVPGAMDWAFDGFPKNQDTAGVLFVPALSTSQNARNCMAFARARGWRRVILVTGWYHLPRARLLTWIYSRRSGIDVESVASAAVPPDWYREGLFWMEWPKLWGSLGQVIVGSMP
jgi:hypothetical protein